MRGPHEVRADLYTDTAVFTGRDRISGPQLSGDAWDVEEQRLCSLTYQLSKSTIQGYRDESQIRLRYLMQERHSVQRQDFIWILPSYPCKGLLPTQFPSNFPDKIFLRNLPRLPRTLKSHSLSIFYLVKLRIFGQPHTTWSPLYTPFAFMNLLLTLT